MALIPWKPSDLDRFFENDDWFFPVRRLGDLGGPAMDVYETDKEVVAELNAPGMSADDFTVSVKDGVLSVRGAHEEKSEDKGKGYWKREIRRGSFERAVHLPADVKEDNVDATYAKGILKITMQKAEAKPASQIKVKSGDEK
jgi:HSP20 family protein